MISIAMRRKADWSDGMKKVCILFGGVSNEHEVSLVSAGSVLRNIDRRYYDVRMLGITRDGRWQLYTGPAEDIPSGAWEKDPARLCPAVISPDRTHRGILALRPEGVQVLPVDVAFAVVHGAGGEDGSIQGLFELGGIPYVGAGVLESAVCMDKEAAHILLTNAGIPKTKLVAARRSDASNADIKRLFWAEIGYPMFVKPANAGSSVGVSKAADGDALERAIALAFEHDSKIVAERPVEGQEVECAVMGNETPTAASVLGEIAPSTEFYDYDSKYKNDSAALYVPARIPAETAQQVRRIAVEAYKAVGCRGFARVDFFVGPDGAVTLNEINTIPGFTSISMFPKLWEAAGVSYPELIDRLLRYAEEK